MQLALKDYVRHKAAAAGSSIVYVEDGKFIKENPRTGEKIIFKSVSDYHN